MSVTCPHSDALFANQSGYINGKVVTIDGGEWLAGAGQFNFLGQLSDEKWKEMREMTKTK